MYVDVRRWSIKRKQEMAKTRLGQQDLIFFSQGGDPWPVSLAETTVAGHERATLPEDMTLIWHNLVKCMVDPTKRRSLQMKCAPHSPVKAQKLFVIVRLVVGA